MPHRVVAPSVFVPTITGWKAPPDEEIKRRRSFSVVVYAPKYDTKLREEAEITVTKDGKFQVEITKVGQNTRLSEDLGTFDSYEEAKAELFNKFDDFFNRPSEYSIKYGGRRPNEKVWDTTRAGREVKASVSILEGDEAKTIIGVRTTEYETKGKGKYGIRIPDVGIPSVISVRTLYPSYFKHVSDIHTKRIARLKRFRRSKK